MHRLINGAQPTTAQHPHDLVFSNYLPGLKRHRLDHTASATFKVKLPFGMANFRRKLEAAFQGAGSCLYKSAWER
jgi:hypothetical protein